MTTRSDPKPLPLKTPVKHPRRRRRGLTILEAVLWATILVVVIGGLIATFTVVNNNLRENRTVQLAQQINASVRSMYLNSRDYRGLTAQLIINLDDIPDDFVRSSNIQTPEGRNVGIAAGDGWWSMRIPSNREGTCVAVLNAFRGDSAVSLGTGTIASAWASNRPNPQGPTVISASSTGIATAINTACNSNSNAVVTFR